MKRRSNTKIGDRFGRNLVVARLTPVGQADLRFLVRCDCGNERVVTKNFKQNERCPKCTGRGWERVTTGERHGTRTVIAIELGTSGRKPRYLVRCDCGEERKLYSDGLRRAARCRACDPWRTDKFIELRLANPVLYERWRSMIRRCSPGNKSTFAVWAGRGIRVCEEWRDSFPAFVTWALANGFRGRLTLDRIDENKGYEPGNCQWLTRSDNSKKARAVYRGPLRKNPFYEHFPIEALWGNA